MRKKIRNLLVAISIAFASVLPVAVPSYANTRGGYSQNDVRVTSGLSEESLRRLLPERFKSLSSVLYDIEHRKDPINALFITAIMKLETGNGTSYSFRHRNNVGGIMKRRGGQMSFKSKEDSLNYMHSFLNRIYVKRGIITTHRIGRIYSAGGNWSSQVNGMAKKLMNQIPQVERETVYKK